MFLGLPIVGVKSDLYLFSWGWDCICMRVVGEKPRQLLKISLKELDKLIEIDGKHVVVLGRGELI